MAKNIIIDSKRRSRRATFAANRLAVIAAKIEWIAETLAQASAETEWTGQGGAK